MTDSTSIYSSLPFSLEGSSLETFRASDSSEQLVRQWRPAGVAVAVVIYLHGIEGHSAWFASTARYLASQGVVTRALERRGSGVSNEPRGDMPGPDRLLKDVEELIEDTVKKEKNIPIFLMANCWGAKLAALVCRAGSPTAAKLSGLVMSSPAVAVKIDLPLLKKLEIIVRYVSGSLHPIKLPLIPEHFTDNPEFLSYIQSDELRLREATARFLIGGFILTLKSAKASPEIEMPMLIVQSGVDDIVDIAGVQKWFERSPSTDKTFKLFDGARHSLDFHREPAEYRTVLLQWLSTRARTCTLPGEH